MQWKECVLTAHLKDWERVICLLLEVNLGRRLLFHPSSSLYLGRCLFQRSPSFPATFLSIHFSHSLPWPSLGHFHCLQLLHLEITWGTRSYLSSLLGWLHPISPCWVSVHLYALGPPQYSFPSLEPTLQYCDHHLAKSTFECVLRQLTVKNIIYKRHRTHLHMYLHTEMHT